MTERALNQDEEVGRLRIRQVRRLYSLAREDTSCNTSRMHASELLLLKSMEDEITF